MRLWTVRVVCHLLQMPSGIGPPLRRLVLSPTGSGGTINKTLKAQVYPLPLPAASLEAFRSILDVSQWKGLKPKQKWSACKEAWWGLLVVGLNCASGFTNNSTGEASDVQKKVLSLLWEDAVNFVNGDLVKGRNVCKPDSPWSDRLPTLSVNYTGDVVEKARWLTGAQVIPGLPPEGFGGSLNAVDFCTPWVRKHLEDPSLTRLDDSEVAGELPFATVHASHEEWEQIAVQLVQRGVAVVLEEEEIQTFKGRPILNGAFGVTKPNKFVDVGGSQRPVLRLIMDFRAANTVHRMLPGSVDSLVGPAKWQAIVLGDKQTLVTSGDDLVSCFYLFRVPRAWSQYFAFRKQVSKAALGLEGPPGSMAYVASAVLPMGWAAAVTIMQHIHRGIALQGLPEDREVHRSRALPEVAKDGPSSLWNLYIDDFTNLEVLEEESINQVKAGVPSESAMQNAMQQLYQAGRVPYSSEKSSCREPVTETLGALVDGRRGVLGVSTHRALDLISLSIHLMSLDKVPVKWLQVYIGKFVHVLQFRRPLFGLIRHLWKRLQYFSSGRGLAPWEVEELFVLVCALPLCYTDLRAGLSKTVTSSDASEWGGGLCASIGLTALGRNRAKLPRSLGGARQVGPFIAIEWFAGIGGLGRALHRLGLVPLHTVVCEQDKHCLRVLHQSCPGATVWKDIKEVTRQHVAEVLSRYPEAEGVIQAGGSPCQGLSQLSSGRQHFEDPRSNLFYTLADLQKIVKKECELRGLWHFGLVENVICDEKDQQVFREVTEWHQYRMCSGTISHVRRPRFFWTSEPLSPFGEGDLEDHGTYYEVKVHGPKEPPEAWVCPNWEWVSQDSPVSLPTFTRSIPRVRPPPSPAGIAHTPEEAQQRWRSDNFRYPPYTYKSDFCFRNGVELRVAGPSEREILMGFLPSHTAVKVGSRLANYDQRCSAVGNSFHTGVMALIIKFGLQTLWPSVYLPGVVALSESHLQQVRRAPKEIYHRSAKELPQEPEEDWLARLEEREAGPWTELGMSADEALVRRFLHNLTYRGSDVHVDSGTPFRPDRLPREGIDPRQWKWKTIKGWKWSFEDHINVLEMHALYQTVVWRMKTDRLWGRRFVHLVDSQVVLGVATKGRTSSRKLENILRKYNLLLLAVHTYPILGWVISRLNPADPPSRWYVPQ